ncbi:MAG: hypothetical protein K0Q97_998 [Bacillota bacterium]|nr:hypothetical protein [Bacillota bacterium]
MKLNFKKLQSYKMYALGNDVIINKLNLKTLHRFYLYMLIFLLRGYIFSV